MLTELCVVEKNISNKQRSPIHKTINGSISKFHIVKISTNKKDDNLWKKVVNVYHVSLELNL